MCILFKFDLPIVWHVYEPPCVSVWKIISIYYCIGRHRWQLRRENVPSCKAIVVPSIHVRFEAFQKSLWGLVCLTYELCAALKMADFSQGDGEIEVDICYNYIKLYLYFVITLHWFIFVGKFVWLLSNWRHIMSDICEPPCLFHFWHLIYVCVCFAGSNLNRVHLHWLCVYICISYPSHTTLRMHVLRWHRVSCPSNAASSPARAKTPFLLGSVLKPWYTSTLS